MRTSAPTPSSPSTRTAVSSRCARSAPPPRITSHCCGGPINLTPARIGGGQSRTAGTCHADSNVTCSQRVNKSPGCHRSYLPNVRDSARTYGKSDPIDALAVARAALREPDLPTARLDGPERALRLLVDHRDDLGAERARIMARLRWHLHELDPEWEPAPRSLDRPKTWTEIEARLGGVDGLVARLARELVDRCRRLTSDINALTVEITALVTPLAPTLMAVVGVGPLTAAKIVAETAGIDRFRSANAYARHTGTAPLPVWSANQNRHRLSRTGNRQLNAPLHRSERTQARWHPGARALLARRRAHGDGGLEALRVLKRHLSNVVYSALKADATTEQRLAA